MKNQLDIYKIFCAYCISPLEEGEQYCKNCQGDTRNDPGVEMTKKEYLMEPRKQCIHCDKPIIVYASICFACRQKQR